MGHQTPYEPVTQQVNKDDEQPRCVIRKDDTGVWNLFKTYWIYLLHLSAGILFVVLMLNFVHGHNFRPGAPPSSLFKIDGPLYQTQVNGLVSLALVFVRLLAICCTGPIIWTVILVLLEKRGMTLAEISRMNVYLMPILPKRKTRRWWWFTWTCAVVVLLWPPNFASPIANSSLAWIPGALDLGTNMTISLNRRTDNPAGSFWALRAPEFQMYSLMRSVVRTGASPPYVLNTSDTRRYFARPPDMTNNSVINLPLPYFDVKINWTTNPLSFTHGQRLSWSMSNTTYSDYVGSRNNGPSRALGTVMVLNSDPWDRTNDWPSQASKFTGQRLIAVEVSSISGNDPDADEWDASACPKTSETFVSLPESPQVVLGYRINDSWSSDCYQVGIATIEAGLYQGQDCSITIVGATEAAATCSIPQDKTQIEDDWVAPVAVNMLSETMKSTVMLEYTTPWMNNTMSLDEYTTSILRLAYHATWSTSMDLLMKVPENSTFRQATPMVRASVDKGKMYAWFAMQLTIAIAAGLVLAALQLSSVKFVRDTTLTPLRLDFNSVTHHRLCKGLCTAAALNKEDKELPMIKFHENSKEVYSEDQEETTNVCRSRVIFVNETGEEIH